MRLQSAVHILDLIGKTPVVKLRRVVESGMADVYLKLEWFNPGGSIKDRIAKTMIEEAEKLGKLKIGMTIIEPTSGNTGISLALVGAVKGYRVILVMPDQVSMERRQLLEAYGAELIVTPGSQGMRGAIERANDIESSAKEAYFMPQQFHNLDNVLAHKETTGPEIVYQMQGELDAFIAGVGTGGTIMGVGEVLKKSIPDCQLVAVEPYNSPVLSGGKPGMSRIQGLGAGFVPEILNLKKVDRIITVQDDEAIAFARRLAREEGILAGISSGANVCAALQMARELGEGHKVLTISPSNGERYLSTGFYSDEPVPEQVKGE